MNDRERADSLICAALRGQRAAWPSASPADFATVFLARVDFHGVEGLVFDRGMRERDWPLVVCEALRQRAFRRAAWEMRHQQEVARLIERLTEDGLQPLLLKGTALAYGLYPDAAHRARGDTDILVPALKRDEADAALVSLGFDRCAGISGEFVSYQAGYAKTSSDGAEHVIDLHWQISNSALLSRLFSHGELLRRALPLSRLSRRAQGTGLVDALVIACLHRQVHTHSPYYVDGTPHYSADRLIWLHDIHLLASALAQQDWDEVVRLARQKALCAVCLDGLETTRRRLGTELPERVLQALSQRDAPERPAIYLRAGPLHRQWMDLRALPGLAPKLRLVKELALPSADYMRSRHPEARRGALPWLYLRRGIGGSLDRLFVRRPDAS